MTTSVDIQGMIMAQQDFQSALDEINTVYTSMTEEQANLAANWSGEAASAFGQALQAWLDDLYQVQGQLIIMTETLSEHTGIYANTNETSQQTADAFHQGLQGLEGLPNGPFLADRIAAHAVPALRREAVAEPAAGQMFKRLAPRQAEERVAYRSVNPTELRMAVKDSAAPGDQPETFRELLPMQQGLRIEEPPAPLLYADSEPATPLLPEDPGIPAIPAIPATVRYAEPVLPLQPEESYPALPRLRTLPSVPPTG